MERLTERLNNIKRGVSQMDDKEEIKVNKNFLKYVCEYLEHLKSYKDAKEQGLLLRLPCKVGDTIYRINIGAKEPIIKMRVLQVQWKQLHKDRVIIRIDAINDDDMGESCYLLEDIGKTVFLTKEEAEQALAEMRNIEEAKDNLATEIARIGYTDKADARERIEQALK